ncbi:hypothetical protein ABW20_dc0110712 [Dactylellina cionopaga]|nr:hypothetical protein ABW20_dc0110712 [Dactylellina cionopaga]
MPDKRRRSSSPPEDLEGESSKRRRVSTPPQECQPSSSRRCVICLDTNTKYDPFEPLSCGHEFHRFCLWEWLSWHRNCPLCRRTVSKAPETEGGDSGGEGGSCGESPPAFSPRRYEEGEIVEEGDQEGEEGEEGEEGGEGQDEYDDEDEEGEEEDLYS